MADHAAEKEPRSLGSCLLTIVSGTIICVGVMIILLMVGLYFGVVEIELGDSEQSDTYALSITVPDGQPGRVIRFGERDVVQLELVRNEFQLDPYRRGNTQVWVTTGFLDEEMYEGYCFAGPVTIVGARHEETLIEAGECVDRWGRLDRRTVEIMAPRSQAQVGDTVEVDVRIDVNRPETLRGAALRFLVNGELIRETSADSSTGNLLDLTDVEPGPMTVRVEFVLSREDTPHSAAVVDLLREAPTS